MKFEDLIYSECMNAAPVQISICRIHILAENTNTSSTQIKFRIRRKYKLKFCT